MTTPCPPSGCAAVDHVGAAPVRHPTGAARACPERSEGMAVLQWRAPPTTNLVASAGRPRDHGILSGPRISSAGSDHQRHRQWQPCTHIYLMLATGKAATAAPASSTAPRDRVDARPRVGLVVDVL